MIRFLTRLCLYLISCFLFHSETQADFKGDINFSKQEIQSHRKHILTITNSARKHLEFTWKNHVQFHKKHGVSKYYGDRNRSLNTPAKRRAALKGYGAPMALEKSLLPTSCIGLTLESLRRGFHQPRDPHLRSAWQKIEAFTRKNHVDGSALIHALQKLGWKIYYWNPNPANNHAWDKEETRWKSKGWHAFRYATVRRKGTYYYNKVDDAKLLVNFGETTPNKSIKFPYFVGVAHTGYHVFPGFYGNVIEAHSTRKLNSISNLEKSMFNPLGTGGGPRWTANEKYRSGLIAVPPL